MPFTKEYIRLKEKVDSAFDLRKSLSLKSQAAYRDGNGALAKKLSIEAKEQYVIAQRHKSKFDRFIECYNIFDDSDDDSIYGYDDYDDQYSSSEDEDDSCSSSNDDSDYDSDDNSDYETSKYDANEDPIYQAKKSKLDSAYRAPEAKLQLRKAENLKKELTDYTFFQYNDNRTKTYHDEEVVDSIDLHGLYVEEAKRIFISRMKSLKKSSFYSNYGSLRVVVGRGNHSSQNGTALIKAAIQSICITERWNFRYQDYNDGELLVDI
ncbi:hypothetical protein WICPIJ_007053 [Wickerhamomyces pijperi]|uniref:Smr domain-containing protein n=1 Tax=Wickerhamomyces pijperi TaxID=599730 RepID=A0A9P8Q194_WICPI|nr:hypothetical protein WICPIJ_007053 [Wickerhamomyces pijperi]